MALYDDKFKRNNSTNFQNIKIKKDPVLPQSSLIIRFTYVGPTSA